MSANTEMQATLNRMPCSAHTLQLSVKKSLRHETVASAIESVRKTCKFNRISSAGAAVLEKRQAQGGRLVPIRLCLDVPTRWASTFFMLKRYLELRVFVDEATEELCRSRFQFKQLHPSVPLTGAQVESLKSCVDVIALAEDGTAILGRTKQPTTHIKDVMLAGIVQHCKAHEASS